MSSKRKTAIIGAGFSGAYLASQLCDEYEVFVFDKARGPGGRMSCRSTELGSFNHGAPYFVARSDTFKSFLRPLIENGTLTLYSPEKQVTLKNGEVQYKRLWYEDHFQSEGGMNQWLKPLLEKAHVQYHQRIQNITIEKSNRISLLNMNNENLGFFDEVLLTAPLPQSFELCKNICSGDWPTIETVSQYSLLSSSHLKKKPLWQIAHIEESELSQIIQQQDDLCGKGTLNHVSYSCPKWTQENIAKEKTEILDILRSEFCKQLQIKERDLSQTQIHFWRYAKATIESKAKFLTHPDANLSIIGDGFGSGNAESSFLSCNAFLNKP